MLQQKSKEKWLVTINGSYDKNLAESHKLLFFIFFEYRVTKAGLPLLNQRRFFFIFFEINMTCFQKKNFLSQGPFFFNQRTQKTSLVEKQLTSSENAFLIKSKIYFLHTRIFETWYFFTVKFRFA
jgi:hypothetical protein